MNNKVYLFGPLIDNSHPFLDVSPFEHSRLPEGPSEVNVNEVTTSFDLRAGPARDMDFGKLVPSQLLALLLTA